VPRTDRGINDFVLFSDATIKAATNDHQRYVTISRGRKGIRIYTPDKEQFRENVIRWPTNCGIGERRIGKLEATAAIGRATNA